mgnify:CR=1 FL=1
MKILLAVTNTTRADSFLLGLRIRIVFLGLDTNPVFIELESGSILVESGSVFRPRAQIINHNPAKLNPLGARL